MRNTDSSGKTSFTVLLSCFALARSWPNGFSMTTRRHWAALSPGGCARPERFSWLITSGNALGGTDR